MTAQRKTKATTSANPLAALQAAAQAAAPPGFKVPDLTGEMERHKVTEARKAEINARLAEINAELSPLRAAARDFPTLKAFVHARIEARYAAASARRLDNLLEIAEGADVDPLKGLGAHDLAVLTLGTTAVVDALVAPARPHVIGSNRDDRFDFAYRVRDLESERRRLMEEFAAIEAEGERRRLAEEHAANPTAPRRYTVLELARMGMVR